ncbi:hypothetical protein DFH28DRAFT_1061924 [Melampsora americana]|nr:hypothetical protein DFH28DRAFT_1061924 [Melampsora americana]
MFIHTLFLAVMTAPFFSAHPYESKRSFDIPGVEKSIRAPTLKSKDFFTQDSEDYSQTFMNKHPIKDYRIQQTEGRNKISIQTSLTKNNVPHIEAYDKLLPKSRSSKKESDSIAKITVDGKGKDPIGRIQDDVQQGIGSQILTSNALLTQDSEDHSQKFMDEDSNQKSLIQDPRSGKKMKLRIILPELDEPRSSKKIKLRVILPKLDNPGTKAYPKSLLKPKSNISVARKSLKNLPSPPDANHEELHLVSFENSSNKRHKVSHVAVEQEERRESDLESRTGKDSHSDFQVGKSFHGLRSLDPLSVIRVLQWQCRLALAKKPGLSEEIEAAFREFSLPSSSDIRLSGYRNHPQKQIMKAMERIRTHLVMVVLGAVNMLYHDKDSLPSIELLLGDAWKYIHRFLKYEINSHTIDNHISISSNSKKSFFDRGGLVENTLRLPERGWIPPKRSFITLYNWATSSQYAEYLSEIPLDYSTFIDICETTCKNRGKGNSIYRKRKSRAKAAKAQERLVTKTNHSTNSKNSKLSKLWYQGFPRLLKKNGDQLIIGGKMSDNISVFFLRLHLRILDIFTEKTNNTHDSRRQTVLTPVMVDEAIEAAQNKITPAFLGLMGMIHPARGSNIMKWDEIYQSGWNFLQDYFSTWIDFLSKNQLPIAINPKASTDGSEVEWSNVKNMIYYLSNLKLHNDIPHKPLWHFVNLWHELNVDKFDSLPPNQKLIKKYYFDIIDRKEDKNIQLS